MFYLVQSGLHYHLIVNSCHDIAKLALNNNHSIIHYIYSQTCIKRSPFGQRKSGLLRQVAS